MSEVEQEKKRSVRSEIMHSLTAMGAVIVAIYASGYLRGNDVYPDGAADKRLEQIIRPRAVNIARFVLDKNKELNKGVLVTQPGTIDGGAYVVSLDGFTDWEWVHINAEMYRGKNGLLDPNMVNDVDMVIRDYVKDGSDLYGGPKASWREIELIYGSDATFTHGDWGVEDTMTPHGYHSPTVDISTELKNPQENANAGDAKKAEEIARTFTAEALVWKREINSPKYAPYLKAPTPR
jgi:hypothetical protein